MTGDVRSALRRLEREAHTWRTQPMKRIAARGKLMRPVRVKQFHSFGPGSLIDRPTFLYGADHMAVGAYSMVLRGCWLAVESCAWDQSDPVLRLGNRVGIRMSCTVSASESVVIEDDVVIAALSTVIDSDHTWSAGRPNVLDNPTVTAPVRIGRGTWIGDRVAVLRGSDIGEQCLIGANSVVRGTIPDFSIAVGSPARVVGSTR
jgi:lipopolysaccharide O-acetyltransferase